jgi:hypothetical protein
LIIFYRLAYLKNKAKISTSMSNKFFWIEKKWAAAASLVALILIIPIWYFQYIPLNDWPNHLASMHLLIEQQAGKQTYIVANQNLLIPNSMAFWLINIIGPIFGVELAGRILLSIIIALSIFGCAYFFKTINPALAPLGIGLGSFMAYNWFFSMGFLNFSLSLPIFLIAAGYWMEKNKELEARASLQIFGKKEVISFLLSAIVALSHLISAIMLACFVLAFRAAGALGHLKLLKYKIKIENARKIIQELKKSAFFDLATIAPIAIVMAASLAQLLEKETAYDKLIFGPIERKLFYLLLSPEPTTFLACCLIIACYFAIQIYKKRIAFGIESKFFALSIISASLAIFLPENIASWQFVSPRFWPFFCYFAAAALFIPIAQKKGRKHKEIIEDAAALLLLFAVLAATIIFFEWNGMQAEIRDIAAVSSYFEPKASVLPIGEGFAKFGKQAGIDPYLHSWGYWVMQKDVFVPYIFSWSYSPVRLAKKNMHGAEEIASWIEKVAYNNFAHPNPKDKCAYWRSYYKQDFNWALVEKEYDYVVLRKGDCDNESYISSNFEKIAQHGLVYVFENKMKKDARQES